MARTAAPRILLGPTWRFSGCPRRVLGVAAQVTRGERAFHEVLNGELREKAAPLPEHGLAQRALGRFIGGPFHDDDGQGGPGGWWILTEVEVELAQHEVVRPDLTGWRRERLPAPWGMRPIRVAPDWICEILSPPTNAVTACVHKAELYARSGVGYYWLVAPSNPVRTGSDHGAFAPGQGRTPLEFLYIRHQPAAFSCVDW
jgi:Uma2 family endonuclease